MPSSANKSSKYSRFHGRVENDDNQCAIDGCCEQGEFRAPPAYGSSAGFDGPGEYRWLCLDHVREFNQSYDYFGGMDAEQIFAAQHPVSGWESSRRVYHNGPTDSPIWSDFADPLDAIGARFANGMRGNMGRRSAGPATSSQDQKALKTLGLGEDANRRTIRQRYSELVRKYHPDRNGGNRNQEKHLADVIAAYTHLKTSAFFERTD